MIRIAAPFLLSALIALGQQPTPEDEVLQLIKQGQYPKAHAAVTRLIDGAAASGRGIGYRAALFQLLGIVENYLGHFPEAQRALEKGVELSERSVPTAPPELLVGLLVTLAEARTAQAHFLEADRALRRALAVAQAGLRPDHPRLAAVHDGFGLLYLSQGQQSRAEKAFRRSLDLLERSLGPNDVSTAAEANSLASLLVSMGRNAEAIPLIERSRKTFEQAYGPSHLDVAFANYSLGLARMASDPVEAEKLLHEALTAWRATQPERHATTAKLLLALSVARFKQGDVRGAIALDAQGLEILRELFGPEHPGVVRHMYERAWLLKAAKQGKEATALKKEADRIRAVRGYPDPDRLPATIDIRALRRR